MVGAGGHVRPSIALVALAACTASEPDQFIQPSAACRAESTTEFHTRFVGTQLAAFEGTDVIAVTSIGTIGSDGVICRAGDREVITNGEFSVRVDNRRDEAVYPTIGAFIDSNANGTCDADRDVVWVMFSGAAPADQEDVVELTAEHFVLSADAEGCGRLR
jgi:hypothetical protein